MKIVKSCLKEDETVNVVPKATLQVAISSSSASGTEATKTEVVEMQSTYVKNVEMLEQCVIAATAVKNNIIMLFYNNYINIINTEGMGSMNMQFLFQVIYQLTTLSTEAAIDHGFARLSRISSLLIREPKQYILNRKS